MLGPLPAPQSQMLTTVRSGYFAADITDIQEIVDDAENKLISKIHNNPSHVLALFLPECRSELAYSLRTRRHDRRLSQRSTRLCDNNFITQQLFTYTHF